MTIAALPEPERLAAPAGLEVGGLRRVAGGEQVGEVLQGGAVLLGVERHLGDVVVDDVAAVGEQERADSVERRPERQPDDVVGGQRLGGGGELLHRRRRLDAGCFEHVDVVDEAEGGEVLRRAVPRAVVGEASTSDG